MNDEATLRAFARKLGPVAAPPPPPAAAAARLPPPKPPAEIATLLEAARWTDLEAVEDFLAVGKSVSEADPNGRTPLHLAVAFGSGEDGARVVRLLLESGAPLEAGDDRGNTSLHYAAGYARAEYVSLLLEAGAAAGAQNFVRSAAPARRRALPPSRSLVSVPLSDSVARARSRSSGRRQARS